MKTELSRAYRYRYLSGYGEYETIGLLLLWLPHVLLLILLLLLLLGRGKEYPKDL